MLVKFWRLFWGEDPVQAASVPGIAGDDLIGLVYRLEHSLQSVFAHFRRAILPDVIEDTDRTTGTTALGFRITPHFEGLETGDWFDLVEDADGTAAAATLWNILIRHRCQPPPRKYS